MAKTKKDNYSLILGFFAIKFKTSWTKYKYQNIEEKNKKL